MPARSCSPSISSSPTPTATACSWTPTCSPPRASACSTASTPLPCGTNDLPDINALKVSFPRPVISGDFGDTDITGGQQYALVIDMIVELDIEGAGADLVVHA